MKPLTYLLLLLGFGVHPHPTDREALMPVTLFDGHDGPSRLEVDDIRTHAGED